MLFVLETLNESRIYLNTKFEILISYKIQEETSSKLEYCIQFQWNFIRNYTFPSNTFVPEYLYGRFNLYAGKWLENSTLLDFYPSQYSI